MTKQPQQNQSVALIQKDITNDVNAALVELQEEGLVLPKNYNHSNALKSAFFALSNNSGGNLLQVCTPTSVANALLDMVTQGLSPAKTQCYFINYGGVCKLMRSYFGTQTVVKRLSDVNDIWANVIFAGDEFEYENDRGRDKFLTHKTSFLNRDNEIIGAYSIIEKANKELELTVMTKKEIDASWSQAKTKNVQNKFPQEMAKRTVINRAAKAFINTSDDSDLLIESINNTTENEFEENERREINPQHEINENANKEMLDIESEKEPEKEPVIIETPTEETPVQPEPEPTEEPERTHQQDIFTEPEPVTADGPNW